jgi:ABC-type phosphate transport system ATPase subunit
MAYINSTEAIESLAASIGENVYIDVAKWHLYLRDAHLNKPLAEQLYPLLTQKAVTTDQVQTILKGMAVKLGGGKMEVSLADLLPMQSQVHLMDVLEKYQRDL